MTNKAPAFQFYVKDWLCDPQLGMCSHSTKGIWIDALCYMWDAPERGSLSGTTEQLAKLLHCSNGDIEYFIEQASTLHFCDICVTDNGTVTLRNRRMWREEKDRSNNRIRQQRHRDKQRSHDDITPPSSSSSSLVSKDTCLLSTKDVCPQQKIVDLYHEVLPELRKVKIWSEARQKMMRQRWKHSGKTCSLEWWREFFEYIKRSDFLMGKVKGEFQADLEWIVRPKNFVKIVEGKYENR